MGAQAVRLSNVDIDNALKNKEFEVIFQPIFDLGNGALARVEAFVRWRHPALGLLPPGAFISFFESQGRMSELTRYVLGQALSQYLAWRGPSAPGFSINLALSDLADDAFASHFSVLLRDHTFPADLITLECPMPPVTMPVSVAAEQFARLSGTGARLAIEVRGRANDFLRMIDPFPFDEIKTGGAAILRFARTVRGPGLSAISELIDIANNANAAITAVGVEDQASLAALRSLGFAAAQGNHLGRVGALASFRPSRVNDVRTLLGLDPLSKDDLNALFRTEAPDLQQPGAKDSAAPETAAEQEDPQENSEALVERLEARLSRQEPAGDEETPAQRRPKLAAAKAAAIARAKRKAAERASADASVVDDETESAPDSDAARHLQQRLAEEFGDAASQRNEPHAPMSEPEEPTDEEGPDFDFVDDDLDEIAASIDEDPDEETDASAVIEAAAGSLLDIAGEDYEEEAVFAEPETVATGAAASQRFARASLAVGRTGAHFRPGIRIGAAQPLAPPREYPAAVEPQESHAPDRRQAEEDTTPDELFAEPQGAFASSETGEEDAFEMVGEETPVIAESTGALASERLRRKRSKNFLTRKYRLWPTHFWPRSWKRAWQRYQTSSAAKKSRQETIAAE